MTNRWMPALALHDAARRYCIDRDAHWRQAYADLCRRGQGRAGSGYSPRALDTFPRYNVLRAILTAVERIDPWDLPPTGELVERLAAAGVEGRSPFTDPPNDPIAAAAMADERVRFVEHVRALPSRPRPVDGPPLLPRVRVLSPDEMASWNGRLLARWGCEGGSFVPVAHPERPSLRAYHDEPFHEAFPPDRLRRILDRWNVRRLYELREWGDRNLVLSSAAWDPSYDGAEGFWFDDELDWLLYASHEGTVTTGGTLTDLVLEEWPEAAAFEFRVTG